VKKSLLLIMSTALAGFSASAMGGERVGDFALIDHLGAQHHMAWYDDQRAVVILPQGVDSTDAAALDALQDLRARYEQQGVSFFLLNPGLQTDREAVVADLAELGVELPVLMDDTHLVTEALGVTRMDEVVVYDPSSFEISYRGPIQAATETAITGLLNGERSDLVAVAGTGSMIANNIAEHASLSYVNDIAPIIAENCAECHREGGIAPFAMDSSLAVQGWSPMIREVVLTKRMPPGQIDNKVGHKMKNEMNLSDEEMQKLVRWVDAGSPVDGDEDPLTALTWTGRNALRKTGALLSKGAFKSLKQRINPEQFGGAPLLGLTQNVIKAHGSSNRNHVSGAVKIALDLVQHDMLSQMALDVKEANEIFRPERLVGA